jgi:hypothetical protein
MIVASFLKIVSIFTGFSASKINIGDIIILLLTFLTVFYYIAIFTLYNKGKIINYMSGIALIPVLWTVAILVVNYVSLTQMSTTPEYCYTILAYLVNILFFYYVAKVLSGYKNVLYCLIASAFAVVINGVAYLSPLIYDISKNSYISAKQFLAYALGNIIFIFIIPFALSFIMFLLKETKNNIDKQ